MAGKLGVKSGEGFYDYSESKKAEKVSSMCYVLYELGYIEIHDEDPSQVRIKEEMYVAI